MEWDIQTQERLQECGGGLRRAVDANTMMMMMMMMPGP